MAFDFRLSARTELGLREYLQSFLRVLGRDDLIEEHEFPQGPGFRASCGTIIPRTQPPVPERETRGSAATFLRAVRATLILHVRVKSWSWDDFERVIRALAKFIAARPGENAVLEHDDEVVCFRSEGRLQINFGATYSDVLAEELDALGSPYEAITGPP